MTAAVAVVEPTPLCVSATTMAKSAGPMPPGRKVKLDADLPAR
jgi:hypothetical protein